MQLALLHVELKLRVVLEASTAHLPLKPRFNRTKHAGHPCRLRPAIRLIYASLTRLVFTSPSDGGSFFGAFSGSLGGALRLAALDRAGCKSQFTDCPGSSCSVSSESLESGAACWDDEEEEEAGCDGGGGGLMISWRSVLNLMVRAIGAAGAAGCGAN